MLAIIAQAGLAATLGGWIIVAIVVAAIVAILLVFVRASGIGVPPWVVQILWIILAAALAILAIKLVLSLL
jgi:hypothetical protein